MRKLITIILILVCSKSFAQVYQLMPQYGYQANRFVFDSTLQIPTTCGVPTLKSVQFVTKRAAIAFDSCNNTFYQYNPKTLAWSVVSGGGGSTDTTSLSNRINLKIDSIKSRNDSVFAYKLGVAYFQYKDTTIGTLQSVTNKGNTTTNAIYAEAVYANLSGGAVVGDDGTMIAQSYEFVGNGGSLQKSGSNNLWVLPNYSDTLVGKDYVIDTLKRSNDSIFAYKNHQWVFQFKDSVGTNPPPNGYYGAFQDTTTQTAASINTAYPVNLRVTDLSNGITISNNSKIKIANAGIYNIQFSLQLEKTGGSGNMIADIWLRKNGVNIDGTTGKVVLTGSANASPIVAAWNYVVAVSSNDSLELMWSTSNDNVVIKAAPATSPHPSIPSSILTVTQQSGIMAGTGISPLDTANMLLPYLRKIDTTSLSNRIDLKLSTADTSVFQRKSIPAYSILANNTSAAANATNIYFKDTSGTYTGTPAWNGTAPTTLTATYRWTRIGKRVDINIVLVYTTAGSANSTLTLPLPSDAPTPVEPSGATANSNFLYPAYGMMNTTLTTLTNAAFRGGIRKNSGGTGYEFHVNFTGTPIIVYVNSTYWTN
jgi:hypothetical protein